MLAELRCFLWATKSADTPFIHPLVNDYVSTCQPPSRCLKRSSDYFVSSVQAEGQDLPDQVFPVWDWTRSLSLSMYKVGARQLPGQQED